MQETVTIPLCTFDRYREIEKKYYEYTSHLHTFEMQLKEKWAETDDAKLIQSLYKRIRDLENRNLIQRILNK